jgi:nitrogen-specific signal transduction histidine kinase/ActR/RegA family two-component response regulator
VATDVTDLRQAEERFAQAQKMEAMGRLAGGVAHDFNNLLTVILGETELLQRDLPVEGEQAEMLRDIHHAADSAAALTRQLLAFSRKQLVAPTVFDINTAIVETSKMLRRLIGEQVQLETRLAPDAGVVRLDRGQLEQVMTNLAVNARDAMPNGGLLVVETSPVTLDADYAALYPEVLPGDYVLIAVNDTGAGMTPEVKANIFDPFFTTKERGKGTGLGLAMIHGIVKQAGGHIAVYSELGVGTTFRLYFPRVEERRSVERLRSEKTSPPRGDETVLLVEDEELVRRVATRMLSALGYSVLEARDAREAQEILERRGSEIKLLFTDVVLPGTHGRELAEHVTSRFPAIRVLFTSGYSDDVVLQHRLLAENVVVLEKPYNRDTLAAKIREALDA